MDRPSNNRNSSRCRRRWLLIGLLLLAGVFSVSGCTTTERPAGVRDRSPMTVRPPQASGDAARAVPPADAETVRLGPEVSPVSYKEKFHFAAAKEPSLGFQTDSSQADDFGALVAQASPLPQPEPASNDGPTAQRAGTDLAEPNPSGEGRPIDYFVRQALASHPRIQAARQRVAAATNVIPQAKALPDPNFSNTFWPLHDQALQTAAGRIGNQMSLNQQIPFPEKLRSKARIASREVQIAQAEVDSIAREITESVRLAYYEVWFNTRAIKILEETKVLVDDLTEVAEARYKAGGSQQDVLRAQLENDRVDDQLINLRKQKAIAQADLAVLLQQPVKLVPETGGDLDAASSPSDIQSLIALAEQCNPSLQGLASEIQRDRERQRLACLQQYPDFNVGMHWGLVSDDHDVISPVANGHDNISLTFGTTLPIWREKINSGVREAGHRAASTTRRLEATRDEIYGKLRRLMAQADALIEQRDIYRERIVPRTEDTLKLAIADYRGERTDFFSLIETYRELLMFETQLARIEANLAGIVAQIDRTVGCPVME